LLVVKFLRRDGGYGMEEKPDCSEKLFLISNSSFAEFLLKGEWCFW